MIKPYRDNSDSLQLQNSLGSDIPKEMSKAAMAAITRLREAYDSAYACSRDPWEFSVELTQMQKAGIETHVLRMLICRDWIVHRKETTEPNQGRRTFEPVNGLVLSDKSCFVISKEGYALAKAAQEQPTQTDNQPTGNMQMSTHHSGPSNEHNSIAPDQLGTAGRSHQLSKPVWDRERRELRFGDIVVKRFKWPAENQELVLNAFEDLGWPARIDNPLEAHPSICPKRRLHDTLKCLNRKQVNELIKFRGDGTGLGVLLEINLEK